MKAQIDKLQVELGRHACGCSGIIAGRSHLISEPIEIDATVVFASLAITSITKNSDVEKQSKVAHSRTRECRLSRLLQ